MSFRKLETIGKSKKTLSALALCLPLAFPAVSQTDIEEEIEIEAPIESANTVDHGWFRWFSNWETLENTSQDIQRIVETVYGDDVEPLVSFLDIDGDESAEVMLQFTENCRPLIRLNAVNREVIACPYAILKETSRAFWEPVFTGVGQRAWQAISPEGRPAGIVLDGVYWTWEDDVMMPLDGLSLNFADAQEFQNVPDILSGSQTRPMVVAPIETNFLTGWLSVETVVDTVRRLNRWRYANAEGQITASGFTDFDRYGIRVVETEMGGIEIVSRSGEEVTVERISVGLTQNEWLQVLDRPILPPGWQHVTLTQTSVGESDPNGLFDDIDILEGGSQTQGAIFHTSIETPHGFLLFSYMQGSWCGANSCPARFTLQDPTSGERNPIPEDIMVCQNHRGVITDPERLRIRACDRQFDLGPDLGM